MASYKLLGSGGTHMTDDDYLTRGINNKQKEHKKVFKIWPAAFVVALLQSKGKINNILTCPIFRKFILSRFFGGELE